MAKVLAINAGSSTLKWQLFEMPAETVLAKGMIDRLGMADSVFTAKYGDGKKFKMTRDIKSHDLAATLLLEELKDLGIIARFEDISGIGHRVVAGGETFQDSVVITVQTLRKIESLAEYAPLHNPTQAYYIRVFMKLLPRVLQVAVFDTSLFAKMPPQNYLYSIPYDYYEKYGARKYGAHGTSHRYVSQQAAKLLGKPLADLKMITLHLGSGASITAFDHGQAVDTSMGFTPLAGITMSTRCGDIDVSLLPYLMEKLHINKMSDMIDILNHKSGLLGLSQLSPDQRDLEQAEASNPLAKQALAIFINRVVKYIGAYAATMNGLDALVFTAGSGENGIELRANIIKQLAYFGVQVDPQKNAVRGKARVISTADSKVAAVLMPTNEELMIVRDVMRLGHNDPAL